MHVCPAANSCVWKILSVAMAKRQQSLLETFQKQKSARVDEECSVHRSEECSNNEFYGSESDIDLFETIDSNSRIGAAASDQAVSQASLSCSQSSELLEFGVVEEPYQPRTQRMFPKKKFGQKKPEYRSFRCTWFDNALWRKWLHWEVSNSKVYCIVCRNVHILNQLTL